MTIKTYENFELDEHIVRLLLNEPFFAAISRRVDKRECKDIPTAGVRVNKNTQSFELLYNPDFMGERLVSDEQRNAVLRHEYYHLIFEHVTGRRPGDITEDLKGAALAKMWNCATDMAINSHLSDLPDFCLFPGRKPFEDYPTGMNAEWYYNKIKNDPENQEMLKRLEGVQKLLGDHEGWSPSNGSNPNDDPEQAAANDMARGKLKEILRKAVGECAQSNSWGTISQEMRQDILDRLKSRVNWRNILRYFIKVSQRGEKVSSIRRINKRYPYIHAGKKITRHAKIAIAIDQSGSVGDELLCAFYSELDALSKLAEFTVIPFDHAVASDDKIYVWKKGQRRKAERVLCGGTDFSAPTKWVNDRSFDAVIFLTDLQAEKPIPSKCQRMWLTDEKNAEKPYFATNEMIVPITIGKK